MEPIIKYGVRNIECDDFLHSMGAGPHGSFLKLWVAEPERALKFDSPREAKEALDQVQSSYELEVVQIIETENTFLVGTADMTEH